RPRDPRGGPMSSQRERRRKAERISELLETEGPVVNENVSLMNRGRYDATENFDEYEDLRDEVRAIKEEAIADLPNLLETLRESVERNGGNLYLAADAADANRYITTVADERDAESVVKSKSMTTEEIEVNDALEQDGIDVWETDLGEFVLQIADES